MLTTWSLQISQFGNTFVFFNTANIKILSIPNLLCLRNRRARYQKWAKCKGRQHKHNLRYGASSLLTMFTASNSGIHFLTRLVWLLKIYLHFLKIFIQPSINAVDILTWLLCYYKGCFFKMIKHINLQFFGYQIMVTPSDTRRKFAHLPHLVTKWFAHLLSYDYESSVDTNSFQQTV